MDTRFEPHRVAKIFADNGTTASFADADALLETFSVEIRLTEPPDRLQQILLYTLVNVSQRCFLGGIYVSGFDTSKNEIAAIPGATVREACRSIGARNNGDPPPSTPMVVIGPAATQEADHVFFPVFGHWWAGVYREPPGDGFDGGELGAVLAAGLCAAALFMYFEHNRNPHAVRSHYLNVWNDTARFGYADPDDDGEALQFLPQALWLLGMGHLGQAYAWLLGLLPYPPLHESRIVVQDDQLIQPENAGTSALYWSDAEVRKTDLAKDWLQRCGFEVCRVERRLGPAFKREPLDPAVCLAGLDDPAPRRWAANAGFSYLVDGGLGASARTFSAIAVNAIPGATSADTLWPDSPAAPAPKTTAYDSMRDAGLDDCGIAQLGATAVAAPFVGSVCSVAVLAQLLKPLHGRLPNDRWRFDARSPSECTARENLSAPPAALSIPFVDTSSPGRSPNSWVV